MNDTSQPVMDTAGLHTLQVIAKAGSFNRWMYDEIKPFLKGDVLEIGSGIGNISKQVIRDGFQVTLSDYNPEYCAILKKNFTGNTNLENVLRIDLLHPGFEMHYESLHDKFDSIFLLNVIEHLANDALALRNCCYMLKPSGHLLVLAPAYPWLYCRLDKELGHFKRYRLTELKKLFHHENLALLHGCYFNFTGIAGWLLFGKIFRKKLLGSEMKAFNSIVPFARLMDKIVLKKAGLSVIVVGRKHKSQ